MSVPRELARLWRRAGRIEGMRVYLLEHLAELLDSAERRQLDFQRFHWGDTPDGVRELQAPSIAPWEVLTELGELVEVAYATAKAGDPAIWVHAFEARRPVLGSTEDGGLIIAGGDYRITARGIEG